MIKVKSTLFIFMLYVFNNITTKMTFLFNNKNKICKSVIINKDVDLSGDKLAYPVVFVYVFHDRFQIDDVFEKKVYDKLNFFKAFSLYKKLISKYEQLEGNKK